MAIVDEIERIKTNIANAYTEIENKGVVTTGVKNSDNLATTISAIQTGGTGGGSTIEKGIIIEECDDNGYATKARVVGLTTLPANAFNNTQTISNGNMLSQKLETVILPNDLESIGGHAFQGNTKLKLSKLPNSVKTIGSYAFWSCTALGLEELPSSLTSIYDYVFYSARVRFTEIPNNITSIGDHAFDFCSSLALTKLSDNITSIGAYAFNKTKLKINKLPSVLKSIGTYAFSQTAIEEIDIPEGVTSFGENVFSACKSLVRIGIPGTIATIPNYFCYNCSALTNIDLSEGTTKIGNTSFRECTALEKIDLPSTITSVGSSAFNGTTKLKTVICRNVTPPTIQSNTFTKAPLEEIFVPDESLETYKTYTNWSSKASIMKPLSEYGG